MQMNFLLMRSLRDHLISQLITPYPDTDPIKADIVKIGLFQENPSRAASNVSVWIQNGDPNDIDSFDGVVTTGAARDLGITIPPYEIGGRAAWLRKTTATFGVYFVKSSYTEEQAAELATNFYGRLSTACRQFVPNGITDDFGETAQIAIVETERLFESGGIKKSTFIWRGYVRIVTVTLR